jgi:hypothetical protein
MKKKENTKEYLMEVMSKLDSTFKPKLNEVAPAQQQTKPSREDVATMDRIYNELAQLAESQTIRYNSTVRGEIVKAAQIIRNITIRN